MILLVFLGDGDDAGGDGEAIVGGNAEEMARYGQLYLYKVSTINFKLQFDPSSNADENSVV